MKVAVIGSRDCGNLTVEEVIRNIPEEASAIISGGARGVDSLAKQAAEILKLQYIEFLPNYECFGRNAPIIRNSQIVTEADMVVAFWDYQSKGTRNALLETLKQEKKIKIVVINGAEERDEI